MTPTVAEKLRAAISQERWEQAIAFLKPMQAEAAAAGVMTLPFDEQKRLFRRLPIDLAARLAAEFPYYHAYVLLHARPTKEVAAVINAMNEDERLRLFDELPEEAWKHLMDELAGREEEAAAPEFGAAASESGQAILEARQIEKVFQRAGGEQIQVIAPTDLSVEAGTIVALLGPSGSGKSTLLRMLSGLSAPSSGEVLWHGKPIAESNPSVAIVFQSFALFPWLTVLENVEVPLLARGVEQTARRQRALTTLNTVGLEGFENAYPKDLSGGMKQRVGFARALAVEPEILFMDEPFSALDVLTAENLRGELVDLWGDKKIPTKSMFLVTHNIEEAVLLADRILVLGRNPARIRADFRVPLTRPRDRNAAEFLLYVDYIYKLLMQPELQTAPPAAPGKAPAKARYPMLPHARPGGIAGLLELMLDRDGKEDMYRIADELQLEVDDLLPIVEATTLLGFAQAEKGDVEITEEGRAFAEADVATKKDLFREAALSHVTLLQQIQHALASKNDHTMPLEFFRDILEEHFSDQELERQLATALTWGRYGEIFTYDSETGRLTALTQPAAVESD